MSFSKAKLKRFNDVDVCSSPAAAKPAAADTAATTTTTPTTQSVGGSGSTNSIPGSSSASSTCSSALPERKEQIEKFFKDAVRSAKDFAIPKDGVLKEEKKSKGLRLFRTPSLPQRLRFHKHTEATSSATNNLGSISSTACSTPLHSAATTPVKELPKSASRLKGKEALQHEIRKKNELLESYISQLDVLKRHVEQLKESEAKMREENTDANMKTDQLLQAMTSENNALKSHNEECNAQQTILAEKCLHLEEQLKVMTAQHTNEIEALNTVSMNLRDNQFCLEQETQLQYAKNAELQDQIVQLEAKLCEALDKITSDEEKGQQNFEIILNLRNTNDALIDDVSKLKKQIEQDALDYAQEKIAHNEMECLKIERNTLKADLASKCARISTLEDELRAQQDELLDKDCEIDAHLDNIRQLCREKTEYVEREHLVELVEDKIRQVELNAAQKVEKIESDLENALECEKIYWRNELDKRQKFAENELIRLELEKQDVMVMLETTNDMLRARDEKLEKYEEQMRLHGVDYYVQLTDTLQKQVVDLKQDIAKTITEKYNYQLTLNNTRTTVNILMERLKKSDADVEQFKAERESLELANAALEETCLRLQSEVETSRTKNLEYEAVIEKLKLSTQKLQNEVSLKEKMFNEILTSEEETMGKFNKIASSFQTSIDLDAEHYLELRKKDKQREKYMADMKQALDEFASILHFARLELESKDKEIESAHEECEHLKLENIALKSKVDEWSTKKENSTDLEKMLDSELRAECEKITAWTECDKIMASLLLSGGEKSVRNDSSNEFSELLKPSTPNNNNKSRSCTTPVRSSGGGAKVATVNTPRTPRTPKTSSHTPRTTPKKTVLFPGKENLPSPQKQVLKARNV